MRQSTWRWVRERSWRWNWDWIFSTKFLLEGLSLLAGLATWYVVTDGLSLLPPTIFPGPTAVGKSILTLTTQGNLWGGTDYGPNIFGHALKTLQRLLIGYSLAVILGVALGVALGWSKWVESILASYVDLVRPIPPISFIPLSIVWFGFSLTQKVFLVFLGGFWPILLNTRGGVKGVSADLVRAGLMLGMNRREILYKIVLPAALPDILTGAKLAVGTSSIAVFGAELAGAQDGLAWLTIQAANFLRPPDIITGIIFIGLIGLTVAAAFTQLERKLLRWYYLKGL
ncbi:MAG: ABC transporter permease [Ardenticatenaceae bacterium]|nr:ABC transporter permease [Ardenticatenaceae bacterium]